MATVYLCDVSYLAAHVSHLSLRASAPPLSWWCAGELAQWGSVVALQDAWAAAAAAAAATTAAAPHAVDASVSPVYEDRPVSSVDRSGYIAFEDSPEERGGASSTVAAAAAAGDAAASAAVAVPSPASPYRWCAFPSPVSIRNKYFGVALSLLVGSAHPPAGVSAQDIATITTAALLHGLPHHSPAGEAARCYGGVLVAHVRQDPAEVPWHVFARTGGGCLFRIVMVFLEEEEECLMRECAPTHGGDASLCSSTHAPPPPPSSSTQLERWRFFAVENGFECVLHAPLGLSATSLRGEASVSLEAVAAASGRRGLLEAPLQGSNRLYQVLCNTLWPAEVREAATATHRPSGTPSRFDAAPNTFVVVGNSVAAMEHVFDDVAACGAARTRRQLRFFTKRIPAGAAYDVRATSNDDDPRPSKTVASTAVSFDAADGPLEKTSSALVLVNKYYAAVAHPRLVQAAYFSPEMQDMLERYWELHLSRTGSAAGLCADAPAVVLWPPCRSVGDALSASAPAAAHEQGDDPDDGTRGFDARSAYPPLEVILDALKRHGCGDIVVVVPPAPKGAAITGRSTRCRSKKPAGPSLTPYEVCICEQRSVEVVDLSTANPLSVTSPPPNDDAPPVPVLRDEDDVCATRSADRLAEILHCVQWDRSHPLPPLPTTTTTTTTATQKAPSVNSCLVMAYGADAFQEEAWLSDVAHALRTESHATEGKDGAVLDAGALATAAPSMVPALSVTVHNAYFSADVRLCFEGGLRTHYGTAAASRTLPVHWLEAHEGYVLITSFSLLQEAAETSSGRSTVAAALATALAALARQAAEWIALQPMPSGDATAYTVDTPLAMLYVADVSAEDAVRVAHVEALLSSIVLAGGASSEGAYDLLGVPLEVLFVGAAASGDSHAMKEGLQRLHEAVKQQLWPHRRGTGSPTALADAQLAGVAPPQQDAVRDERAAAVGQSNGVRTVDVRAAASSVPTANAAAVTWVAPAVGCALPPSFLIDPETLRSVPLSSLVNASAPSLGGRDAPPPLEAHHGGEEAAAGAESGVLSASRRSACEAELMVWMEKMKTHGHRLGEVQRKEQAATLALALEALL